MNVDGISYRTIWLAKDGWAVEIINQTRLPFEFVTTRLESCEDVAIAIRDMWVRGAPLIGATAAYGIALAMRINPSNENLETASRILLKARPTAVNLRWAIEEMLKLLRPLSPQTRCSMAYDRAAEICDEDVLMCSSIGEHGMTLIQKIWESRGKPETVNILTHCNAGWLATVDWGTAMAPVYKAFNEGIPVHVWVDETRPRNQGASLTAWELGKHGVPYTIIVDNVGGHLMQHGLVDICITGTDRTTAIGDVCNKIGTYLKALAAYDNQVPFYVGLPGPTIDWTIEDGLSDIPIECRKSEEVTKMFGRTEAGQLVSIDIVPEGCKVINYAFDVTPARLVTGLITERGVCAASRAGLSTLYPEFSGL